MGIQFIGAKTANFVFNQVHFLGISRKVTHKKGNLVIRKFILSAGLFLSFFSFSALATDQTVDVQIIVRQPIVFTLVDTLDFGTIEAQGTAETYTIVNTSNSSVAQLSGAGSVVAGNSAEYTVVGDGGATVTVNISAGSVTVGPVTFDNVAVLPTGTQTLPLTLIVGGTADVTANPTPGTYADSGTFVLTVIYQ